MYKISTLLFASLGLTVTVHNLAAVANNYEKAAL